MVHGGNGADRPNRSPLDQTLARSREVRRGIERLLDASEQARERARLVRARADRLLLKRALDARSAPRTGAVGRPTRRGDDRASLGPGG